MPVTRANSPTSPVHTPAPHQNALDAFVKKRDTAWGIYNVDSPQHAQRSGFPFWIQKANEGSPNGPQKGVITRCLHLGGRTGCLAVAIDCPHPSKSLAQQTVFDLIDVPGDGWPWLNERNALGPLDPYKGGTMLQQR